MTDARMMLVLEIIDGLMSDLMRLVEVIDGTEYIEDEMKGDSSCHIPNDKYRANYDRIFRRDNPPTSSPQRNGLQLWTGNRC